MQVSTVLRRTPDLMGRNKFGKVKCSIYGIMNPSIESLLMLDLLTFRHIYVLKLIWGYQCLSPGYSVRYRGEPDHSVLGYLKFHLVFLFV